ncbi:MAG: competence protein ComE [Oscillatoriales cyanobacterium SM2_1_8]|nr:competence protein ComE [Oscillatoriales cyanobacterium SM2_1_8]
MNWRKLWDDPTTRRKILLALLAFLGLAIAVVTSLVFFAPKERARFADEPKDRTERESFPLLPALPQHPQIQVYNNHSRAATYIDPYRNFQRYGDNFEQILIDQVQRARRTIDVAAQEFRVPNLMRALLERQKAGIKVRVIIENSYNRTIPEMLRSLTDAETLSEHVSSRYEELVAFTDLNKDGQLSEAELGQRDAVWMMRQARLPYLDDTADGSKGSGLMHHKFMVVDGETVVVSTANFTPSDMHGDFEAVDTRGNANNLVAIQSPELARIFLQEFNLMWGDGPGGKTDSRFGTKKPHRPIQFIDVGGARVGVKFSPDSRRIPFERTSNGAIAVALTDARQQVDFMLFVFAEPRLGNLLEQKQAQGVKIRGLVDSGFAYTKYATTLDMWGYLSTQDCASGNGRPWAKPLSTVGIARIARGDKLHHKSAVVDRQTIVTGSHNWSMNANHTNDETLLVIRHPTVAAHYDREFERLYEGAILGPSARAKDRALQACPPKPARSRTKPRPPAR